MPNANIIVQLLKRYKMKKSLIIMCITVTFFKANAAVPKFFMKSDLEVAISCAKKEHRPLMIYVHSTHCFESKKFTREVISNPDLSKVLKASYNCVDAEISTDRGTHMATKYNIYKLPSIILIDPVSDLEYQLPLKSETQYLIDHFNFFLSSCSIMEQISFYLVTSNISRAEASKKVAISYVKHDKKNSSGASAQYYIYGYTLNQPQFADFEAAYIEEWQKSLKLEDGNNKVTKKTN